MKYNDTDYMIRFKIHDNFEPYKLVHSGVSLYKTFT